MFVAAPAVAFVVRGAARDRAVSVKDQRARARRHNRTIRTAETQNGTYGVASAVLTGLEPAAFALTGRRANETALQDREGDDSDDGARRPRIFAEPRQFWRAEVVHCRSLGVCSVAFS